MDVVDLIVAIVVVTILVTVVVGLATYVAYKFRLAREPGRTEPEQDTHFFFVHDPPADTSGEREAGTAGDREARPADTPSIAEAEIAPPPGDGGPASDDGERPVREEDDRAEPTAVESRLRAEGSA